MKRIILLSGFLIYILNIAIAQSGDIDADYLITLNKRAGKIVEGLKLEEEIKAKRVQEIIVAQYYELGKIHELRDKKLEEIREFSNEEKEGIKQTIQQEINSLLYKLHAAYVARLLSELTTNQTEQVKDGMTYGLVAHTYSVYLELLPELTEEQKRQIYRNLAEARELAMDAGSSGEKHACFGKYKGRINNYLSAEGYKLKEAEQKLKNQ